MTAEQIDEVLRTFRSGGSGRLEEALKSLADLSVSVLRMIDSRREQGIPFESSYNEQELRRALASMADQKFQPGPSMTPQKDREAKRTRSPSLDSSVHGLLGVLVVMDEQLRGDLEYAKVNGQGYVGMALSRVEDYRVVLAELLAGLRRGIQSTLDEPHDFQRFEHRAHYDPARQLKIVCRCGWSTDWIDLDPDGDVARSAAQDLLGMHITEAISCKRKEPAR